MQIKKLMKVEKVSESPFSGQNRSGVKLITHTVINDFELTQTFYFFENPAGKKVVVTATTTRDTGTQYEPVFDGIMGAFSIN